MRDEEKSHLTPVSRRSTPPLQMERGQGVRFFESLRYFFAGTGGWLPVFPF
jgi:hypothetical protein